MNWSEVTPSEPTRNAATSCILALRRPFVGEAAQHRGSVRASHPAAPGSNPVSTWTHLVVSSAYERDFANAFSGSGLLISTTTTTKKRPLVEIYNNYAEILLGPDSLCRIQIRQAVSFLSTIRPQCCTNVRDSLEGLWFNPSLYGIIFALKFLMANMCMKKLDLDSWYWGSILYGWHLLTRM